MVFKKNLTPIGRRGKVVVHRGKGAREQRLPPGGRESLTGQAPMDQMMGRFPKAPPEPPPTAGPPAVGPPAAGPPGQDMPPEEEG